MVTRLTHPIFSTRVGGRLSLDFVNTVRARMPRGPGAPRPDFQDAITGERLTDVTALVDWATWVGLLTRTDAARLLARVRQRPREGSVLHGRAVRLREAIYRLGKAGLERWPAPDDDLALLNQEWARARQGLAVIAPEGRGGRGGRDTAGPYRIAQGTSATAADAILWPIVSDAVSLLTSDDVRRLRQCPATGCGWLFVDTSRSGRRQWCDMAVCGNADKVRRYRERQRARAARALRG